MPSRLHALHVSWAVLAWCFSPANLLAQQAAGSPRTADPRAAPAQRSPARPLSQAVELDPGETCLQHARLVGRVARWLEREQVDARLRVRVQGGSSQNEVVFHVELAAPGRDLEQPPAARRIDDAPEDCDQLHSAIALSIALAIDAALLEARAEPLELPDDDDVFEPPAPPYFRLAAAVLGNASSGVLTDVALGLGARLELGFVRWLDLRLGALRTGVADQRVRSTPGSFDVELLAARLDACAVADMIERLRLLGCAGFLMGSFQTRGEDFMRSYTEPRLWSAVALGLEIHVELSSWVAAAVGVELLLPLQARSIEVDVGGERVTRELTAAGAAVAAGPVFRLF